MNVAFVGLGIMGRPMALNLHRAGRVVFVHGRRPESMAPLVQAGCIASGAKPIWSKKEGFRFARLVALALKGASYFPLWLH